VLNKYFSCKISPHGTEACRTIINIQMSADIQPAKEVSLARCAAIAFTRTAFLTESSDPSPSFRHSVTTQLRQCRSLLLVRSSDRLHTLQN